MSRERAGLRRGFRLDDGSIDVGEYGEIGFALATGDGEPDHFLQRIGGAKQQLNDVFGRCVTAAAQVVEQVLHAVGEIGDAAIAHRRRHPFDRMHGTEQAADRLGRRRVPLPLEQQLIAGAQVFAAFRQEQLGVLRQVHG